jgi:hypothetical protein
LFLLAQRLPRSSDAGESPSGRPGVQASVVRHGRAARVGFIGNQFIDFQLIDAYFYWKWIEH